MKALDSVSSLAPCQPAGLTQFVLLCLYVNPPPAPQSDQAPPQPAPSLWFCRCHAAPHAPPTGSHLLCLSNALDTWDASQRPQPTLAAVALDLCGPLPPYHPGPLHAMVAKGKLSGACKVLRALLGWLRARKHEQHAAATAGDGAVVVARRQAGKGAGALVIDLQDLLQDGLLGSRGLAAFQQLVQAPKVSAPGAAAAAPAAAPPPASASAASAPVASPSGFSGGGGGGGGGYAARVPAADTGAPLRPLPGAAPSAAAKPSPSPLPASAGSSHGAMASGMLDMGAFGDFGGGGGAPEVRPAPPKRAPAGDSGLLDMSAFGGGLLGGDFLPQQAPDEAPTPAARPAASAHEPGMLDMGVFGDFAAAPPDSPPRQPAPVPAPVPAARPAARPLDSGMLDMGMFSEFGEFAPPLPPIPPPPPPPPPTSPQPPLGADSGAGQPPGSSSMDSGLLGMGAFGDFGVPSPRAMPQAPAPQASSQASLESGMLDMGAFGDDGSAPAPQPSPSRAAAPPPPAPAPSRLGGGGGMNSGMLDMHAFGGLLGDYAPPADEAGPSSVAPSSALWTPTPVQQRQAAPAGTSQHPSRQALESGTLDLASFVGGDAGAASPGSGQASGRWPDTPTPSGRVAASAAMSGLSLTPSSLLFTPALTPLDSTLPAHMADPGQQRPADPAATPAAATATSPVDQQQLVLFPRVPDPATPVSTDLPDLLLMPQVTRGQLGRGGVGWGAGWLAFGQHAAARQDE